MLTASKSIHEPSTNSNALTERPGKRRRLCTKQDLTPSTPALIAPRSPVVKPVYSLDAIGIPNAAFPDNAVFVISVGMPEEKRAIEILFNPTQLPCLVIEADVIGLSGEGSFPVNRFDEMQRNRIARKTAVMNLANRFFCKHRRIPDSKGQDQKD